uniref:Clathrin heavy chain n=1 Tax=Rhabditophanes sp. KR3021 TaxID=114890 RepID=A0AC35U7L2_9BILA
MNKNKINLEQPKELLCVHTFGVSPQNVLYSKISFEHPSFILCNNDGVLVLINIQTSSLFSQFPIPGIDAFTVNCTGKIISIKRKNLIQHYNLQNMSLIRELKTTQNVPFWKWVGENTIALVRDGKLYHWMLGKDFPEQRFILMPELVNCTIINYLASDDGHFSAVLGICMLAGRLTPRIQLNNKLKMEANLLEGNAGCFIKFKTFGAPIPLNYFCYVYNCPSGAKIRCILMDKTPNILPKEDIDVPYPMEQIQTSDIPIGLHFSSKEGIFYTVTKNGYIYMNCINTNRKGYYFLSKDPCLKSVWNEKTDQVLVVNNGGRVFGVTADKTSVEHMLSKDLFIKELKHGINARIMPNYSGIERSIGERFDDLCSLANFTEAAKLAASDLGETLRSEQTIKRLAEARVPAYQDNPLNLYCTIIMQRTSLNKYETIEFVKYWVNKNRVDAIVMFANKFKLEYCEEIGNLIFPRNKKLAYDIHKNADTIEEFVSNLFDNGSGSDLEQLITIFWEDGDTFNVKRLMIRAYDLELTWIYEFMMKVEAELFVEIVEMLVLSEIDDNYDVAKKIVDKYYGKSGDRRFYELLGEEGGDDVFEERDQQQAENTRKDLININNAQRDLMSLNNEQTNFNSPNNEHKRHDVVHQFQNEQKKHNFIEEIKTTIQSNYDVDVSDLKLNESNLHSSLSDSKESPSTNSSVSPFEHVDIKGNDCEVIDLTNESKQISSNVKFREDIPSLVKTDQANPITLMMIDIEEDKRLSSLPNAGSKKTTEFASFVPTQKGQLEPKKEVEEKVEVNNIAETKPEIVSEVQDTSNIQDTLKTHTSKVRKPARESENSETDNEEWYTF